MKSCSSSRFSLGWVSLFVCTQSSPGVTCYRRHTATNVVCSIQYLPCVRLAGAVPKVVELQPPGFEIDRVALREAFTTKTKMIIMNTPHNPTGRVASVEELQLVSELCAEHNVIAVADDVYETVLFGDASHVRLCDQPGMQDRTLTIGSAGKIFNLTGWRVGWCTGPPDLVAGVRTIHGYSTFAAATPLQEGRSPLMCPPCSIPTVRFTLYLFVHTGIAAALDGEPAEFYTGIADSFAKNYELLAAALESMEDGLVVCRSAGGGIGGYFLVADVAATGKDAMEFCKWLAATKKVACVPLSVFYQPRDDDPDWRCTLVRFAICKQRATIEAAVRQLLAP